MVGLQCRLFRYMVSIHAPGRGATVHVLYLDEFRDVSIHAPGRGATYANMRPKCSFKFQFTHPGGVRLWRRGKALVLQPVSIHAPGRGATLDLHGIGGRVGVSIHAPGRGATKKLLKRSKTNRCFNSRTREGCDAHPSIPMYKMVRFNSRTREGCDWAGGLLGARLWGFNSRTREGCDWVVRAQACGAPQFQFTHPGGVRHTLLRRGVLIEGVSIHAPGRGATVWCKVAYYGADKQA